jgi:hypothetical protein
VKDEKAENRNREAHQKAKNQASGQFGAAHHVRRFETHERICEGAVAICALLLTAMGTFGGHPMAFMWTAVIAACAVALAFCFGLLITGRYDPKRLSAMIAHVPAKNR